MQQSKRPPRQRPPRVQMTYDVEIGGSIEQRELPFVIGVLGDFGGASDADKRRLKERTFVAVNRDNFDEVMRALAPRAVFRVANLLARDDSTFEVDLRFAGLRDFRPEAVLPQVEPLRKLLEARERLAGLRATVAGTAR
jgi:type VI secretion system protein ImpB